MSIPLEWGRYLGIPYCFKNGPDKVPDLTTARREGANCQALAHLIQTELGSPLPLGALSKEIFEDDSRFPSVPLGEIKGGEIFLFGREQEEDPRKLHKAVYTGLRDEEGDPLLIHSNGIDGESSIWPLGRFANVKRYQRLYAIKRICS